MPRKKSPCVVCGKLCNGAQCWTCYNKIKKDSATFDKVDWRRRKLYGISSEDFEKMWTEQEGCCILCQVEMRRPESRKGQAPDVVAIDHCHKTKEVRGLLCNSCNKGLGHFKDNIQLLERAIKYLGGLE